jgi:hypothetical protein
MLVRPRTNTKKLIKEALLKLEEYMEIINDNYVEKVKEQKYLGKKGFPAFITLISAFIPLSTDYLSASVAQNGRKP